MTTDPSCSIERILAVDDDPILLKVYQRALSAAGYSVDVASTGVDAVTRLKQHPYSAILSDISMPGMDGIGFLKMVRSCDANVPVILVTGMPTAATAAAAVNEGAFRYLVKPLDIASLEDAVRRAVRLHRVDLAQRQMMAELGAQSPDLGDHDGVEVQFEKALASLWIAFQPIVEASTGAVFGYEGLLRTREPSLPSPGAVLSAAERLGRLSTLGRAIRRTATEQLASVDSTCSLFVNLHPADLADDHILDAAAPLSRIAPRVVLEVTERSMLDSVPDALDRLSILRGMGFRLAIDDLGAGYAGLTSFVQLEPEVVKLDMSLIRGIGTSRVKQRLVKSVVEACVDFGIHVVAEGIETALERTVVTDLGCDLLQGYLLGRPAWPLPSMLT